MSTGPADLSHTGLVQHNIVMRPGAPVKQVFNRHCRQVAYLGHIVSEDGAATDPSKVQKVQDWQTPISFQEVLEFIGLASYYLQFVRDFSSIAEPLHVLTKKYASFNELQSVRQHSMHSAFKTPPDHCTGSKLGRRHDSRH